MGPSSFAYNIFSDLPDGYVHRDIKALNIMVYRQPKPGHEYPFVKVADFSFLIDHSERLQAHNPEDTYFRKIYERICIADHASFTMSPEELIYCLTGDNSVFADSVPRAVGNEKR